MVIRKRVLSESSHRVETHLGVVVKGLEVYCSVFFELCLDEKFIKFW